MEDFSKTQAQAGENRKFQNKPQENNKHNGTFLKLKTKKLF